MSEREVWLEQLRFELQWRRQKFIQINTLMFMAVAVLVPLMIFYRENLLVYVAYAVIILTLFVAGRYKLRDSATEAKDFQELLDKALLDGLPVEEVRSEYSRIRGAGGRKGRTLRKEKEKDEGVDIQSSRWSG